MSDVVWAPVDAHPSAMFMIVKSSDETSLFSVIKSFIIFQRLFPEFSVASVNLSQSSIPINFYTRQQLVLGPALNVTVHEGDKALLPCIAPHLGDRTVESSLN